MERYFETLGTGVTLGGASGLGYLAVNHPPAFRLLALVAVVIAVLGVVCAIVWNISNATARSAVTPFIAFDKAHEALSAVHARRIPFVLLFGSFVVFVLYLALLYALPWLLALRP